MRAHQDRDKTPSASTRRPATSPAAPSQQATSRSTDSRDGRPRPIAAEPPGAAAIAGSRTSSTERVWFVTAFFRHTATASHAEPGAPADEARYISDVNTEDSRGRA